MCLILQIDLPPGVDVIAANRDMEKLVLFPPKAPSRLASAPSWELGSRDDGCACILNDMTGLGDDEADRDFALARRDLIALLRRAVALGPVGLHACWAGDEAKPPQIVALSLDSLAADPGCFAGACDHPLLFNLTAAG